MDFNFLYLQVYKNFTINGLYHDHFYIIKISYSYWIQGYQKGTPPQTRLYVLENLQNWNYNLSKNRLYCMHLAEFFYNKLWHQITEHVKTGLHILI